MTTEPTSTQKAKMFALLQYLVPLTTLVMAGFVWSVFESDFGTYVAMAFIGVAVLEFFILRYLAIKTDRQAQRDRG